MFLGFDFYRTRILYGWMIILPDIESLGYAPYRHLTYPLLVFVDSFLWCK